MIIMGISGGTGRGNQDGAACIMQDGRILAAAEEERFCGLKHAPGMLPLRAAAACLEKTGLSIRDVSFLAFPGRTYDGFVDTLSMVWRHHFGYCPKLRLYEHHRAHAAHAFYTSPFERSAVLTVDYSGDSKSTVIWSATEAGLTELHSWQKPDSLGLFYSAITQYLGFQRDMDEYKVMGLAPYGKPEIDMRPLLRIKRDGYSVDEAYYDRRIRPGTPDISKQEPLYSECFQKILPERRVPGETIKDHHRHIAASAQKHLERALKTLARCAVRESGADALCMAGGVSLNAAATGKLLESGIAPGGLWIPCGASDAGLAIGAAMLAGLDIGIRPIPYPGADLGPEPDNAEIEKLIEANGLKAYSDYVDVMAASALEAGLVVAVCSGGMEFGPRALGQRSILARADRAELRDHINRNIKMREMWRPLAPCIMEEYSQDYFKVPNLPLPFMTSAVKVKKPGLLEGVTHVDGTARVQTVGKNTEPLRSILDACRCLTGIKVLINTSLNLRGWPIAAGAREAIACFASGGVDCLILGDYFLERRRHY